MSKNPKQLEIAFCDYFQKHRLVAIWRKKKLQRWKIEINGKILKVVIRWEEISSKGNIISLREMFHRCDLKIELDRSHTTKDKLNTTQYSKSQFIDR
jgi:hypothetical protein